MRNKSSREHEKELAKAKTKLQNLATSSALEALQKDAEKAEDAEYVTLLQRTRVAYAVLGSTLSEETLQVSAPTEDPKAASAQLLSCVNAACSDAQLPLESPKDLL